MASVYSVSGEVTGSVDLPEAVFGIEPNHDVLWDAVRIFLANQRQGSASSKSRGEVNKTGAKPWRQKGTGRARAGRSSSPIWVGGGITFGPKPKSFNMSLPKKKKRLAMRSALSSKAQDEELMVVDGFSLPEPKTRRVVEVLKNLEVWPKKCLLVTPAYDEPLWRAARNLPCVEVRAARGLTPYEILHCEVLIVDQAALDVLGEVLG